MSDSSPPANNILCTDIPKYICAKSACERKQTIEPHPQEINVCQGKSKVINVTVPAAPFTPDGANGHNCSMAYSTTDGSTPASDPTFQIAGNIMTADARHIDSPTTKSKTMQVQIVGNTISTPITSSVSIKVNCSISKPVIPNLNTFIGINIEQTI
jgi:hypothetical protein